MTITTGSSLMSTLTLDRKMVVSMFLTLAGALSGAALAAGATHGPVPFLHTPAPAPVSVAGAPARPPAQHGALRGPRAAGQRAALHGCLDEPDRRSHRAHTVSVVHSLTVRRSAAQHRNSASQLRRHRQ